MESTKKLIGVSRDFATEYTDLYNYKLNKRRGATCKFSIDELLTTDYFMGDEATYYVGRVTSEDDGSCDY